MSVTDRLRRLDQRLGVDPGHPDRPPPPYRPEWGAVWDAGALLPRVRAALVVALGCLVVAVRPSSGVRGLLLISAVAAAVLPGLIFAVKQKPAVRRLPADVPVTPWRRRRLVDVGLVLVLLDAVLSAVTGAPILPALLVAGLAVTEVPLRRNRRNAQALGGRLVHLQRLPREVRATSRTFLLPDPPGDDPPVTDSGR